MKVFTSLGWVTFVAVVSVGCGASADTDYHADYASYEYGEANATGWLVPTENGSFYWVSKEKWDDTIEQQVSGPVKFYLYTNLNPEPKRIYLDDVDRIINSNFDVTHPTKFITHGFISDRFSELFRLVRGALTATGTYNIIVVDWSSMSYQTYPKARKAVSYVGMKVAKFIDFLNTETGMAFENLTLIGHSLGAHVSGFAGKYVKNGKVDVIIGLDPASPLFHFSNTTERLCETDAKFVESIQTTTLLGFREPIGMAAFFPNGGRKQPGCGGVDSETCGHFRSYIYYAEALQWDNFHSIKCKTREEAESKCGEGFSNERLGSPKNYGSSGIFYVPVNKKSPYGLGEVPGKR